MLPATTFSLSIDYQWQALYERIWRPEFFPKWASGPIERPRRSKRPPIPRASLRWRETGPWSG